MLAALTQGNGTRENKCQGGHAPMNRIESRSRSVREKLQLQRDSGRLPFQEIFSTELIHSAFEELPGDYRDRVFSPSGDALRVSGTSHQQ